MTFEPYSKTVASESGTHFTLERETSKTFYLRDSNHGRLFLWTYDIEALHKLLGDWMAGGRGDEPESELKRETPTTAFCPDGKAHSWRWSTETSQRITCARCGSEDTRK